MKKLSKRPTMLDGLTPATKRVYVRMPAALKRRIYHAAKLLGISPSAVIKIAVVAYIDAINDDYNPRKS